MKDIQHVQSWRTACDMRYANTPEEFLGKREARLKGERRERNGELRLAFVKALIASGGLTYYLARITASSNPHAIYLETCAELGIEAAELDP